MSKEKKKSRTGKIVLAIVLTAMLAIVAVLAYTVVLHKPDNGSDSPQDVFSTEGLIPEPSDPEETLSGDDGPKETSPTETQPPKDDRDSMYNFLILGKDSVALNTDVIMLMSFNVDTNQLTIMQIPRDTYICINNYGHKINAVYGNYYNEAVAKNVKDPEDYGLNKLSEVLEQNLCLNIHYYALVNLEGFRNIVDIIGGVEVDIPGDMYYHDPHQNLTINLKKGKQVLNGEKAEMFVRYRMGYLQADIGRMDAQKIFMSALLKKVKESINATTVVKLAGEVFTNIKTDIKLNDMVYFAKNLLNMDLENMTFMSAPGYSPNPPEGYVWYYVINRRGTLDIINKYFNIYDFDITDSIFDKNRIFSGQYATYLTPWYNADPSVVIGGNEHNAEDINQGGIDIPRA